MDKEPALMKGLAERGVFVTVAGVKAHATLPVDKPRDTHIAGL